MNEILSQVLGNMDIAYFIILIAGVLCGLIIGALPGFTATMGVALFVPFSYSMNVQHAFAFLIGLYCSAVYAGSIPAILIRTPGTPAAIATINDGYPMAQKGNAGQALGLACYASVFGGILSAIILMIVAKYIAQAALKFGPQEYFSLAILGLSMVLSMSGKNMIKGLISMTLGLFITVIGMDIISGYPRYTFGNVNLLSGVQLLPVMIGVFAISEVFEGIMKEQKNEKVKQKLENIVTSVKYLFKNISLVLKSSILGTFLGALPGVGAVTASFIGYNEAVRTSKKPKEMGTGRPEGILGPESANNAVTGGALIPLLSLGIPGDPVTAILLGALMIQGLRPGPQLFAKNPEVVFGIYASVIFSYVAILVISLIGIRYIAKIIEIRSTYLYPFILIFCIIGSYALQNSYFDIYVALIFGIIGFFMRRYDFPLGPFTLAMILGSIIEEKLLISLSLSKGSFLTFIQRPISATLLLITFIVVILSLKKKKIR